ncbi:MAG: acetyltransferase [PVC group bacterium]|nr:acetyltransferase [PVC group bacterium]
MEKQNIILVGGGGHCRACIDVIEAQFRYRIVGIVDAKEMMHKKVLGYEIIGCEQDLPKLLDGCDNFFITVGQIKTADVRIEKFEYLKKLGAKFPVIISPSAYVADSARISEGTIVMHGAVVNAQAVVGKNSISNTGAIIEHDASIGDYCHIATGAVVNGECVIGERVFIGSNSVISNGVNVESNVVIGAGSTVIKSILESGTYVGNPARKVNG